MGKKYEEFEIEEFYLEESDPKELARALEQRTKDFAVEIIRFSVKLPGTTESKVIRNQITKSGTSMGAIRPVLS